MSTRALSLWCADERRAAVLAAPAHPLGGLDFVEYRRDPLAVPGRRHRLALRLLKPAPAGLVGVPAAFRIEGGIRIVGIEVLEVIAGADAGELIVFVDREGDLSPYWLVVNHPALDPFSSEIAFSFKAGCPTEYDCKPLCDCEPPAFLEPALDYLAKDYQSFRRLLMDLGPRLNPDFNTTNPADLTVTLIELFAYVGDYLSYFQDAVTTEAFFDTCRSRISAARHARLIDTALHAGRNAAGFVQFDAGAGVSGTVLAGVKLLTRVASPLRGQAAAPGLVIGAGLADFDADPALSDVTVFETAAPTRVIEARNRLRLHDWGDAACCLPRGTREAYLFATAPLGADLVASRPDFEPGEYLLLEEVLGPRTGLAADADARQRVVVRIEAVETATDPAFRSRLVTGVLTPRSSAAQAALPLLKVRWREAEALPRPFCLSAIHPLTGQRIGPITIARGNVTPADHGRTVTRHWPDPTHPDEALPALEPGVGRWPIDIQPLAEGPLTFQIAPADAPLAPDGRLAVGRHDLAAPAERASPAITLQYTWPGGETELFRPVDSLLASAAQDAHFVAEVDNEGVARLRFGDDQYGRRVGEPVSARARYRLGNGRAGNLGAGALVHVVEPEAADLIDPANPGGAALPFPAIVALRQPLPATGGEAAQSIEELRQIAPEAFRAITFRAVTEADYEGFALALPGVAAAKASFRWTGSWTTVFVALHPVDPGLLHRLPGGAADLEAGFAARAMRALTRVKLAGYDLEIRAARYVPVELVIRLCIAPGHFRGDVLGAAQAALSNRLLPGGGRGFFHPLNLRFGEAIYLSRLYALLQGIDGVESARVLTFKRYWDMPNGELERGVLDLGADEVPRLDNDPNQPEFGRLTLTAVGGL
ncbi:MAG: hypothetical protein IOC52_10465 [Methylobacterium sp.]|nr:hypothetical protein [Methylobacterium sp.]